MRSREPTQIPSRKSEATSPKSEAAQSSLPPVPPPSEPIPPAAAEPPTSLEVAPAQEPPAPSLAATARGAWETAVARLRSRQTALSEQAHSANKAEHLARFDREWERLAPKRKSIAAQISGREPLPVKPPKRAVPPPPPSSSLWARAVARLRDIEKDSER